jgi:hypothetical protein
MPGPSEHNLSTDHQEDGDAGLPGDTLDSEHVAAKDPGQFNPGEDAGKAEPSGNPVDPR